MKVEDHGIKIDEESQLEFCAYIATADPKIVEQVLAADEDSIDGRSQFIWVRLQDGTLILGVFPQGDTYLLTEEDLNRP